MLRARTPLLRSAYDELVVVGSRWVRLYARRARGVGGFYGASVHSRAAAAAAARRVDDAVGGSAHDSGRSEADDVATSFVTIIPTLHVASIAFYDRVLEYVQQAVRRNPNVVVLLEGVCDSAAAAQAQMAEYRAIAADASLRDTLLRKADTNTLYPPDVMREICGELKVNYDILARLEGDVRLQDCYLKPKMAALCGPHLRNDADLNLHEVKQLLEEEAARLASLGELPPSSVSVSELGTFPLVRACRERKVARVARQLCECWAATSIEGEVVLPWGFYHVESIVQCLLEGNSTATASTMYTSTPPPPAAAATTTTTHAGDGARDKSAHATATPTAATTADGSTHHHDDKNDDRQPAVNSDSSARDKAAVVVHTAPVIFVESDEVFAKVPFGLPPEALLDTTPYYQQQHSNGNDSRSVSDRDNNDDSSSEGSGDDERRKNTAPSPSPEQALTSTAATDADVKTSS